MLTGRSTAGVERIPSIAESVAIFLAQANVAVNIACSPSMRSLLVAAFNEGWRARSSNEHRTMAEMSRQLIPRFSPPLVKAAFLKVASETRSRVIAAFRQYPFIGLSIDGVTVGSRHFLNIDIVRPFSKILPFTYDLLAENSFRTAEFVDQFADLLQRISRDGLHVAGVTSDGCSFQKKALSWRDSQSIQFRSEAFGQIVFVPCICHRIQNSLQSLYNRNDDYRALIDQARSTAVLLRKSRYRDSIGATCPIHCPTRWIYDYMILQFVQDHQDEIRLALTGDETAFNDDFMILGALLKAIFVRVQSFESDNATLDSVYPGIHSLCREIEEAALDMPDGIADVYREFSLTVKRNCLERTNFLFQLGYVLTPAGRLEARNELCPWLNDPASILPTQDAYSETSSSTGSDLDDSEVEAPTEITGTQESEEDMLDVGEDIGDTDEPGLVDIDAEYDENCELPEHEESPMNDQANPVDAASDDRLVGALYNDAEKGLREILDQFRLSPDRAEIILARFQEYIAMTAADLPMKIIANTNRYPWMVVLKLDSSWAALGEIALRFESLVCNEAVTERTNGRIRRFLSPFRMRMGHAALSARLLLARHGNLRPDPTAPEKPR
jgi:hypothetical protein